MKTATKTKKHLERYQLEKEERKAWQRAYYQRNKEAYREKFRKYFRENKAKYAAQTAARRAKKKQACPSWTDKTQLSRFYGSCPVGFAVDSPRQRLCMHVPWNLQYLSVEENSTKHNSFDFTQENEGWRSRLKAVA